jgi:methane/ammonia monooxygenase subunit C
VAIAAYWGGSYFAEQDAAWHQVTMRDTAFTPSHVALFYGAFPLILYAATGAYLYARTRLPQMFGGRRFPLPFLLVIGGALLLLFQVAFNEFGHTFWEAEEIFSAPLHWPFVVFAYLLGGVLAIWFQTLPRAIALSAAPPEAAAEAVEERQREEIPA